MNQEKEIFDYIFARHKSIFEGDDTLEKLLEKIAKSDKKMAIVMKAFNLTVIADQVIREFQERYPEYKENLDKVFMDLASTEPLEGKHPSLYRVHCVELCQRRIDGEDLRPATDAEVIGAISNLSLKVPIKKDCAYIMQRLFRKHFPDVLPELPDFTEEYQGSSSRFELLFRSKLGNLRK